MEKFMKAEDYAKNILGHISSEKDDNKNIQYLAAILRSVYQMGQGKGTNDMRNKISPLLGFPELDSAQIQEKLASLLSILPDG